ncbi:sensor histidine kinase [Shouchella hunanensis]|uniref:histidine kinase n=1 Tax=Shouchella hunanensis TaxID=766894 RepID=A0ABY7W7G0_9BACI|nr:HAMP domain-containing sensor histidine kinase [Shouchella hunanensis]WDF04880.1 HAMP domain-containing sensor histidine kinase [Shouchella hunanensis]
MFSKLRNSMLWFNLFVTGILIITAFMTIYWSTASKVFSDIDSKLNMLPSVDFSLDEEGIVDIELDVSDTQPSNDSIMVQTSEMFSLDMDVNGRIVAVDSTFDLSDHEYEQVAEQALYQKNSRHPVSWQGRQWRFKNIPVVPDKNVENQTEVRSKLTFLDVTDSYSSLTRLRNTLLAVGGGVLIVLFLISYVFANRAIRPLQEAWEKQKQFVSDASHELKTPLSIMNANLGVLFENQQETIESQLKWMGYMQKGIDRMTYLIHDLLRLARLEDKNHQRNLIPFDFSQMIRDVLAPFEAAAVAKKITFTHDISANILLKGDEEGVQHVLMILLDNAVKYANEGGNIHVSLTKIKSQIQLKISNTGSGIPDEDLQYIFNRFYRADASRKHEDGSFGLGLSIAKSTVELMGGRIAVRSEGGKWTTFTCVFRG